MLACQDLQDLPWPNRNSAPVVASLQAERDRESSGDEIIYRFNATALDDSLIKAFVWDFGDGSSQEDSGCPRPKNLDRREPHRCDSVLSHQYRLGAASTIVVVKLTVRDDEGTVSEPRVLPLRVRQNSRPTAAFTHAKRAAPDGAFLVSFDAGSSVDPDPEDVEQLKYGWSFGDGQSVSASRENKTINHIYLRAGTYRVTLTVSDSVNSSDTTYDWVVLP